MTATERFRNVLNFKPVDRLPAIEWASYWDKSVKRWQAEGLGLPHDNIAIHKALGLDAHHQFWVDPFAGDHTAYSHLLPITDMASYEKVRPFFYQGSSSFLAHYKTIAPLQQKGETVIWLSLHGFFWGPRILFGIEPHMYAFYDYPDVMHRINEDLTAFNLKVIENMTAVESPVFMTIAEDMSYNHGPMLSKECFDEFLAPCYRRVIPALKEKGVIVLIDTDGQVEPMIPWLKEVGFEGCLPLERMAGVDVNRIRKNHPDWRMIGAFDKTIMHKGEAAMRAEFERLKPAVLSGGFIPSVDHQTPPGVSLEDYKLYIRLLREFAETVHIRYTD